jgi:dTMP kinase
MPGRLIVFEGVDGAGKSTALTRVAALLRAQNVQVFLPRTGKEHASRPTRMIRQLTRDPRNFTLSARAELLLYCAREVQVMNELVQPALAQGATVLVDRSFLTPVVLGIARGLSQEECEAAAHLASAGVKPDLTLVFDVHPRTSRVRKRIERIRDHAFGASGRKSLAGSSFKERVRDAYARLAVEHTYPLFHVERATPAELAERVLRVLQHGVAAGTDRSPLDAEPRWLIPEGTGFADALEALPPSEALLFGAGLIETRALRAAALTSEPALVAFTLDPEDPSCEAASELEPEYALSRWIGKPLAGPDDLRLRVLPRAAAGALLALRGLSDELSDNARVQSCASQPDAVLASLAGRDDPRAWQLRERAWRDAEDDARAHSLIGCTSDRSHELRRELSERNPLLGLISLRGVQSVQGDAWLLSAREDAPKLVLNALAGRSDAFAYRLREELFETGREVIDSVRGLPDAAAFALRERAMPRWASTVAHSLLDLPDSAGVRSLYDRCSAVGQRDLHVLRRLRLLDEQPARPSWTHQALGAGR